jgi:hypothetical protein
MDRSSAASLYGLAMLSFHFGTNATRRHNHLDNHNAPMLCDRLLSGTTSARLNSFVKKVLTTQEKPRNKRIFRISCRLNCCVSEAW